MRRLMLGLLIALPATLIAAPPAMADGEVSVTMQSGVLYDSCGDYPYQASVSLPVGYTDYWNFETTLTGPDGSEVDTDYTYEGSTSEFEFFICESPNLPGTYTLSGSGEACNPDYDCVPITAAPYRFTLRLPKTKTKLKVDPARPERDQPVRFIITTNDERPAGYFGTSYADVVLQKQENGRWIAAKGGKTMTDSQGRVVMKYRFNVDRAKVRAKTLPADDYTGSKSDAITVKTQ